METIDQLAAPEDVDDPANANANANASAEPPRPLPRGLLAIELIDRWRAAGVAGLLFVAASETDAEYLGANIHALVPECAVMVFPRWDCLPYEPAGPSREIMGRRMSVLRRLAGRPAEGAEAPLVIVATEAALQRVPPRSRWPAASRTLHRGDRVALPDLQAFLERAGYCLDALVDEPGEAMVHGHVADIFPAGALGPVRIEYQDGRITALHSYDPIAQRTTGELDGITLDAASEIDVLEEPDAAAAPVQGSPWLCDHYQQLETLFDYMPGASVLIDPRAADRSDIWFHQIGEAYAGSQGLPAVATTNESRRLPTLDRLFCTAQEWLSHCGGDDRQSLRALSRTNHEIAVFALQPTPTRAYRRFIETEIALGRTVVLTAAEDGDLKTMSRRAQAATGTGVRRIDGWAAVREAPPASVLALQVDFEAGFRLPTQAITIIAAADLLGSRAEHRVPMASFDRHHGGAFTPALHFGDAIVHLDHGVGLLRNLETVSHPGMADQETIRLEYAGGATLMVPLAEIASIWRYGGTEEAVSLDRLGSESWSKRREAVEAEIGETAATLIALKQDRASRAAPKLTPPQRDYERFVAGFRYVATADQHRAVEDILADLRSGHPMDRLVCGDVGFGKTEIALRAAAAAVLGGAQVAVIAPTTVLARQHLGTFRRRFTSFGIEIGSLSRLVKPAEARAVKKRLADGSLRLVIGTQAIASKGVDFENLGLVIIDEEQRFGTKTKSGLRAFADGLHVLTMTATPIPRTLQQSMVGLQSLSLIETPPARRQPVKTVVIPYRADVTAEALRFERRRGGQSFLVCPRIEDLAPLAGHLAEIVPELVVKTVHGKLPADSLDETMVAFADGEGDVLLTTNIIESGLDLPRANTILIWHPDRFGTAQLHQLRGRVGRGNRRGFAYLLTDPDAKLPAVAAKRLQALADLDRLGAGFALSERDMDLRGAGDILGEKQAGHVRLIGVDLYRHLLGRAVEEKNIADADAEQNPELNLGIAALIPPDYVADAELRLNLYARLVRLRRPAAIDEFAEELEDRFGRLPPPTNALVDLARIREMARPLGVRHIDAGPRGVAITFVDAEPMRRSIKAAAPLRWDGDRLLSNQPTENADRCRAVIDLLNDLAVTGGR